LEESVEALAVKIQSPIFSETDFRAFEAALGLPRQAPEFRREVADAASLFVVVYWNPHADFYAGERRKKAKLVERILKSTETALSANDDRSRRRYHCKRLVEWLEDAQVLLHAELFEVRLGEVDSAEDARARMVRRIAAPQKESLREVIDAAERFATNADDQLAREVLERLRRRCEKILTPGATFHGLAPRSPGRPPDDDLELFAQRIERAASNVIDDGRDADEGAADVVRLLKLVLQRLGVAHAENMVEHLIEGLYPPPNCGRDLRDWRELRGLSVPKAAEILGVPRAMIARAEEREMTKIAPRLREAIRRLRASVARRRARTMRR
jgi:hypothetical protein